MDSASVLGPIGAALGLRLFEMKAILAILLVSLLCGMIGSLLVGNRMAFFSDAMAHCAFAGLSFSVLSLLLLGIRSEESLQEWLLPLLMVFFGGIVGLAIAWVKERTSLGTDTVIGVFFAGAIGCGAVLFSVLRRETRFSPEDFLFGSPLYVSGVDLLYLFLLNLIVGLFLGLRYNSLVFGSFNPSLARSRNQNVRLNNFLFIILLAFVVNLSLSAVGVLLINAMLIVPGATAANVARNLRQAFWLTILISVSTGLIGLWLSMTLRIPVGKGEPLRFGPSGLIVLLSVGCFFSSLLTLGRDGRIPSESEGSSDLSPTPTP